MQTTIRRLRYAVSLAALVVLSFSPAQAEAASATLVVPADFPTIQSAIDNAALLNSQNTGTTYDVLVERGDWTGGGIQLKTGVSVRGREAKETFLSGGATIMSGVGVSGVIISNFTFRNATTGMAISGGSSNIRLFNNIFALNGTGVTVADTSTAAVENNAFYQNAIGISRASDNVSIVNNVFSSTISNATGIADMITGLLQNGIRNNDFNPPPPAGAVIGSNSIPNTIIPSPDPLFVDAANFDFHIKMGSPCIDNGFGTDKVISSGTGTTADIGAYGGQNVDTIPARVTGVVFSAPTTSSVQLSWSQNLDYLVQGYRIRYGNQKGGPYNGTDATDAAGNLLPSPIDARNVITFLISNLTRTVAPPSASPVILSVAPGNGSLTVSWTPVAGAATYNVFYQELPAGTVQQVNTGGNAPSYTLTGLKNGTWYSIQVSALAQSTYYFAVTSYYQVSGADPGNAWESALSTELPVLVGPALEGPQSASAQGAPDELIPNPNLPNKGCFIATAAYGSYDAPAVRVLRSFRDRILAASAPGRAFIAWYYRTSPRLAAQLNGHPVLKPVVRIALEPVVAAAFLVTEPSWALAAGLLFLAAALLARHRRRAAEITRS